jgi:hypothetical protein
VRSHGRTTSGRAGWQDGVLIWTRSHIFCFCECGEGWVHADQCEANNQRDLAE